MMDRDQEEMKSLGFISIHIETFKIIYKWRKIFTQITLSLILPLSFIFLAHIEISRFISSKIWNTKSELRHTQTNTTRYEKLNDLMSSEEALLWVFRVLYFIFLIIFSLLSTAAVVYTIACVYTAQEVNFKKVLRVVPKVWKRLMVTFLCIFIAFIAYNVVAVLVVVLVGVLLELTIHPDISVKDVLLIIGLVLYVAGFVYMTIIWQLASVVTVLEDSYGFKAMIKSKNLIKGKVVTAVVIFFVLNFSLAGVEILFPEDIVHRGESGVGILPRIGLGVICVFVLCRVILFGLVIQTIIYFVCKSYHNENIDKSSLSDHLEVYLGEYVRLKPGDVQLQQFHV